MTNITGISYFASLTGLKSFLYLSRLNRKALQQVLYISYDGLTDALGQSQILPYLRELSALGHRFTVISCEKEDRYALLKDQIRAICNDANIDWVPLAYHKKPPVLSTIRDHRTIYATAAKLHHKKKFDLVHCRSYIAALSGIKLKKNFGIPFLFDMRGFWPDERVDGHLWNLSNPLYRIIYRYFKQKEKKFLRAADGVVILTEAGKNIISSWPAINDPGKITVIPCSADLDLFDRSYTDEKKISELREKTGEGPVIGYYGSLGTWYLFGEMLDQFRAVLDLYPAAKFLLVSNDPWLGEYDVLLKEKNIDKNALYITSSSRKDMPVYIGATDVALFFIRPCFSKLASSPTKHGEIMAMGVPLITNAGVGDVETIVNESKSGFIIKDFMPEHYRLAAAEIKNLVKIDRQQVRESAGKIYALSGAVKKYENIYRKCMKL